MLASAWTSRRPSTAARAKWVWCAQAVGQPLGPQFWLGEKSGFVGNQKRQVQRVYVFIVLYCLKCFLLVLMLYFVWIISYMFFHQP